MTTSKTEDPAPRTSVSAAPPTGSRRNLLKLAAGAAAGGTALALANSAGPVAATDGQSVLIGGSRTQGDSGRTTTVIDYENADGPQVPGFIFGTKFNANILTVRDQEGGIIVITSPNSSAYPAAVGGYAHRAVPNGIFGHSTNEGAGVVGWGSGPAAVGVHARGTRANIEMFPDGAAPPTRTYPHKVGEILTDSSGDLWCCTAAGTPGRGASRQSQKLAAH